MKDKFNNENNTNETWQSPYENSQNYVNHPQENNAYQPNYQTDEESQYQYNPYTQDESNFEQQENSYYYNPYNPYNNQQFNQPEQKPKKNKTKIALITILSILFALAILAIPTIFILEKNNMLPDSTKSNNSSTTIDIKDATENEEALTASEVYKKVEHSIVGVMVYGNSESLKAEGQGSGIIISKDGYIVTNAHVIGNSKTAKATVLINSDTSKKEYEAKIIGLDTKTDLAVLKIEANDLIPAEFGNSDQVAVGSSVLAIGNPAGVDFANSLTRGIVSAVNRTTVSESGNVNYIQTDAAINQGNSGGALLDMCGRVIGVNSKKVTMETFEGMGFAIPSNTVKKVVDEIIKNGYISGRACLGIKCETVGQIRAQQYGVPQGIIIKEILNNSNLSAAGVKTNDIITAINGTNVTTTAELSAEIAKHSINDKVKLTITRLENANSMFNNKFNTLTVEVTLVEDKG